MEKSCMVFKVVMVGNENVGKTAVITRYVEDRFQSSTFTILSVCYRVKTLEVDEQQIKLQLWDTAGQERFVGILPRSHYRGAHGLALMFDLTDENSLNGVKRWLDAATEVCGDEVDKVLLGNKSDLLDARKVSYDKAKKFADELEIPYFETSAKTNTGIEEAFRALGVSMKVRTDARTAKPPDPGIKPGENPYQTWMCGCT